MSSKNIYLDIPDKFPDEIIETIFKSENVRIERIISKGHSSPENFWYNQEENEWVIVLEGKAEIKYDDDSTDILRKGDYLFIPAHKKHRVEWTSPDELTIWLAVFFK